jgi:anti-anti-sigma factor
VPSLKGTGLGRLGDPSPARGCVRQTQIGRARVARLLGSGQRSVALRAKRVIGAGLQPSLPQQYTTVMYEETNTSPEYALHVVRAGGAVLAWVHGSLDYQHALLFREQMLPFCVAGGAVTLDLSGIVFMDAAGARAILALRGPLGSSGQLYALVRAQSPVARIFQLIGVDRLVRVVETDAPTR